MIVQLTKQIDDGMRKLTNHINQGFENMSKEIFNNSVIYNQLKEKECSDAK